MRYVSPSIEPMMGYTPEELLHTSPFEYLHPDDVQEIMGVFMEGIKEPGHVEHTEYRLRHKDGSWRVVEAIGKNLLHDPDIAGVVVNMRDITEYRRIEQELRESEERYRYLVENLNDVVYTVDREGILTYISPAIERLGLNKPEDLIGRPFMRFVHPDDLDGLLRSFERVMAGELGGYEFRVTDREGTVHFLKSSSRPIMKEGEPVGLIGILSETTEQVRADEARRRTGEHFRSLIRQQIRYNRGNP